MTLSAYGTGEKPKLYGSTQSGVGAEQWALFFEKDGVRIWKFNSRLPECTGIVLGDVDTIARRVYPWYDGQRYFFSEDFSTPFEIATALRENLSFYCEMDLEAADLPVYPQDHAEETSVYLRCDEGNPGERYALVEFLNRRASNGPAMIDLGKGSTLDNLCVMYFSGAAIGAGEGCTVQNCEIAYGGGALSEYFRPENGEAGIWTDGNAIHFIGSDCTFQNNYIHDVEDRGINFEIGGDSETHRMLMPFSGNVIRGNLIERCGEPIYIANNEDGLEYAAAFDGMTIDDNYLMYAGDGWYAPPLSYINPKIKEKITYICLNFGGRANVGEHTMRVTNNVFYRAVHSLVCTKGQTDDIPVFEGNVFAQTYASVAIWAAEAEVTATTPQTTQEKIKKWYGDAGDVVILPLRLKSK